MSIYHNENKILTISDDICIIIKHSFDDDKKDYIIKNKDKYGFITVIPNKYYFTSKVIYNKDYIIIYRVDDKKLCNIISVFDINNMRNIYPTTIYNENIGMFITNIFNKVLDDYNKQEYSNSIAINQYIQKLDNDVKILKHKYQKYEENVNNPY